MNGLNGFRLTTNLPGRTVFVPSEVHLTMHASQSPSEVSDNNIKFNNRISTNAMLFEQRLTNTLHSTTPSKAGIKASIS